MRLARHLVCLALAFAGISARGQAAPPDPSAPDNPPILLEFWHLGDDALSAKLADEVYHALAQSPDFMPSNGAPPDLLAEIPASAVSRPVGRRTRVSYTINYSTPAGKPIGTFAGSCWQNRLSACAAQILAHARIAARALK